LGREEGIHPPGLFLIVLAPKLLSSEVNDIFDIREGCKRGCIEQITSDGLAAHFIKHRTHRCILKAADGNNAQRVSTGCRRV
jgi:hypothetical protein